MTLDPLLEAPLPVQAHAVAAMAALVLGVVQFAAPKGTLPHRTMGYVWVALMLTVAISSFWIHGIRQWQGFSVIHLISIYTLAVLPIAVMAARSHKVSAHRKAMIATFVGGLVIAGLFTLMPGRIMARVIFGG